MANSTHFESAKIYQFPLVARSARSLQNLEAATVITNRRFERSPTVVYDGWYHDDAIMADRTPKS